jgi:hypothetical protein
VTSGAAARSISVGMVRSSGPTPSSGDSVRDGEVVGADAVERRQRAAQHVIEPVDDRGALQRPEIAHLLHHADQRAVARLVAAQRAWALRIDIAANFAVEDGVARLGERGRQGIEQLLLLLDEMQRRAPRRARPEPRQPRQELDQTLDLGACRRARHR